MEALPIFVEDKTKTAALKIKLTAKFRRENKSDFSSGGIVLTKKNRVSDTANQKLRHWIALRRPYFLEDSSILYIIDSCTCTSTQLNFTDVLYDTLLHYSIQKQVRYISSLFNFEIDSNVSSNVRRILNEAISSLQLN